MQRIGFVLSPGFRVMSFAVASVFEFANFEMDEPAYEVRLLSETGGLVRTSIGMNIATEPFDDTYFDTLIVGRGTEPPTPGLIDFVRQAPGRCRRVAATCLGAFILAEAGLLDGKRAATHWRSCSRLAQRYPSVSVEADPIFVRQQNVYTSAGVTAGMDLALALVEQDHGPALARHVARELVLFLKRPGGQSQFSANLQTQLADRAPLAELQAWMADHVNADLSVEALARRVSMSPRNFARVFAKSAGVTPARYVERLRVEAARRRLEETPASVEVVASQCGFGTSESMRRSFQRTLRVSPTSYRSRFEGRVA
jgi:transcriptional regulator GlxA family with amidase domain